MRTAGTQDKDGGLWRPCQDLIPRFGSRICKSIIKAELADLRRTWFGSGTAGGVWLRGWGRTRPALALWNSSRSNVCPRTCATDPLMVSSDDWRGRGVAADFAVIGQLRTGAAKSSWFRAEEDAKMAQRH